MLACGLLLCGWLVVEPAVQARKPTLSAPPIDIQTPAGRARLAAALALARMPDGPGPSAAASTSAAAASGALADQALCGEDQMPVTKTPEPAADGMIHLEPLVPDPDGVLRRLPGEADLVAICSRIAELMYEHSDTIIGRNIGGALHKLMTGDPSWLDRAHQEERQAGGSMIPTAVDSAPCGSQRQMLKYFVRLDKVGEVALIRQALRAASAP